jgi:hypothetical protein
MPPVPPVPVPVVAVVPPNPTPPDVVVLEEVPVSGGVVAVEDVVEVVVVLVVVVGVVAEVEDVDGVEVVEDEVVVWVDVVVDVCWRHSSAASLAIVDAPWLRLLFSVGLTVAGRFWTSLLRAALALIAAPQLPDSTAAVISLPWPLSAIDWSPESRPAPPPQAATHETAKPSPPARMARGA